MLIIETLEKEIPVYDITVEDNHNFYGNNILVHNCTEINLPSFPDEDYIIYVTDSEEYQQFIEGLYTDGTWYQLYRFLRYGIIDEKNSWVVDIHLTFIASEELQDNDHKFILNFGEIFSCILGGVNFGNLSKDPSTRRKQFEKLMFLMVYFLDSMIDKQDYQDIKPFEKFTKNRRALGISPGNYFYMLAQHGYNYDTPEARALTAVVFEEFLYYGLKASNEIAKVKGPCKYFADTKYSKGILPIDTYEKKVDRLYTLKNLSLKEACSINEDMWMELRKSITKYGLRNSTLLTAVPSSNSSRPGNMISGINPPQGTEYSIEDNNMKISAILPNSLEYDSFYEYNSAWNLDIIEYWKLIAIMQKFIDQAISINEYVDFTKYSSSNFKIPKKEVIRRDVFTELFGIKTLYYAKTKTDNDTEELKHEEEGCSGGGCTL
jgi:ribonucleoside-diphosphate reductase alpha chain